MNRRLYAAAAVLLILSIGVQVVRDRGWQPYEPANPLLWIRAGLPVKRMSLGFGNVAADFYWMRAVVYYGGKRRGSEVGRDFDQLAPLLDLVTALDTRFKVAYRFGAIFLAEAAPSGPGRPDLAIALLERAIQANPTTWEYAYDVGFVYYWWLKDYEKAAAWFERASDIPGSADWLKPMAAVTLARGADRGASRFLWNQILQTSDVEWLKKSAARSLMQLDAMDQIDLLNQIANRFATRQGLPARSWPELIAGERLRGQPRDPAGVPYTLDAATGRVGLAKESPLWPLPEGQPGLPPS